MGDKITRRKLLAALGAGGATVSLGTVTGRAWGQERTASMPAEAQAFIPAPQSSHEPVMLENGRVIQPRRELAVMHQTDVLVVGGGPGGFIAALAARRAGVRVALVERYGCLGGLWTGGINLTLKGTHVMEGGQLKKVLRGIPDEFLNRLRAMDLGVINHEEGKFNPVTDPEAAKVAMDEMIREAGVDLFFHCWGVDAIMQGKAVRGVVFESKSGRQAILAKAVVDATGDGDVFAAAGAGFEKIAYPIGLSYRLGNVDRVDPARAAANPKLKLGVAEPNPAACWGGVASPNTDGLSVAELSRWEVEHRRTIWNRVREIRRTPGFEPVFLMQTASQIGARISRLLDGAGCLRLQDWRDRRMPPDVVGLIQPESPRLSPCAIPFGALLPKEVDNLVVAGRCVSCEVKMVEIMRKIPACLTTGQAAGAAAALAAGSGASPRAVDVAALQKLLREQGAYLG